MQEKAFFSWKIYTSGKKITQPPVATLALNSLLLGRFSQECEDFFDDIYFLSNFHDVVGLGEVE